jgi:hypothetical protein
MGYKITSRNYQSNNLKFYGSCNCLGFHAGSRIHFILRVNNIHNLSEMKTYLAYGNLLSFQKIVK